MLGVGEAKRVRESESERASERERESSLSCIVIISSMQVCEQESE